MIFRATKRLSSKGESFGPRQCIHFGGRDSYLTCYRVPKIFAIPVVCWLQYNQAQYSHYNQYVDSNYQHSYVQPSVHQEYYAQNHPEYEDTSQMIYRSSKKHKGKRHYDNSGGELPIWNEDEYDYDEYRECNSCSCSKCDDPKPCCKSVCEKCDLQGQSNLVFVPYPYPLVVPGVHINITKPNKNTEEVTTTTSTTTPSTTAMTSSTTTTTQASTTTSTTTTTTKNPIIRNESTAPYDEDNHSDYRRDKFRRYFSHNENNDDITKFTYRNINDKNQRTLLRRTRPNWLPKYGIVPIPNHLAEKLMLSLRNIKDLHARRSME